MKNLILIAAAMMLASASSFAATPDQRVLVLNPGQVGIWKVDQSKGAYGLFAAVYDNGKETARFILASHEYESIVDDAFTYCLQIQHDAKLLNKKMAFNFSHFRNLKYICSVASQSN